MMPLDLLVWILFQSAAAFETRSQETYSSVLSDQSLVGNVSLAFAQKEARLRV